jgi:hypothetical protein
MRFSRVFQLENLDNSLYHLAGADPCRICGKRGRSALHINIYGLLLLQRSLLPGEIIFQGVLLLQGSMSVILRATTVRCQLGLLACDSVFEQGGGVHHKLLMFLTWIGSFACHWHRFYVSFEGREKSK